MSTTNLRGSPLPEIYQVKCPNPIPVEWTSLMAKVSIVQSSSGTGNSYYKISDPKRMWEMQVEGGKFPNVPEVSYEEWKAILTGEQQCNDYRIESLKEKKVAVYCSTQEEWDKVIVIANSYTKNTHPLVSSAYRNYTDKSTIQPTEGTYAYKQWSIEQGYKVITAAEFLAANGQLQVKEYKVGDWVVTTSTTDNYSNNGDPGDVGTVYQVQQVYQDSSEKWYRRTKGRSDGVVAESLRPATPEEIAIAQCSTSEWKVGEELKDEFLDNTDIRYGCKGTSKYIPCLKGGWDVRKVVKVIDGWAYISNTSNLWLPPKHLCKPLSTDSSIKAPKNGKEWICTSEDGVELYQGDNPAWILTAEPDKIASPCHLVKIYASDIQKGIWKVFSTEEAARKWIAQQKQSSTITNFKVGARVKIKTTGLIGIIVRQTIEKSGILNAIDTTNGSLLSHCWNHEIELVTNKTINQPLKLNQNGISAKKSESDRILQGYTNHVALRRGNKREGTSARCGK